MNREIEKKYRVMDPASFDFIKTFLGTVFPEAKREVQDNLDTFFKAKGVDFVRLRYTEGRGAELTTKRTDKGSILDRFEVNLPLGKQWLSAKNWATGTFGSPVGTLEKEAIVFEMPDFFVCAYVVLGNSAIFIEVEAPLLETVERVGAQLEGLFTLQLETQSLFQLFVKGAA